MGTTLIEMLIALLKDIVGLLEGQVFIAKAHDERIKQLEAEVRAIKAREPA